MKKITASDLFFNLYNEGNLKNATEFLNMYPYFNDVFTPAELVKDFENRL